jgi:hypothetical protein
MSDSEEDPMDSGNSGSEDEYDSSVDMGEEEGQNVESDGFANVLAKILNQNIGNKNPVLAKRKTPIMKEQEAHKKDLRVDKKKREDNKASREKEMTIPGVDTVDYERQLRKVSTRGVIALFNAIFQAKKDAEVEEDTKKSAGGKKRSRDGWDATDAANAGPDVKKLTQEKFLEMLKNGKQSSTSARDATEKTKPGKKGEEEGSGWAAIKDDYMIGQKISMKDWDKEVDSGDGGNNSDEDNFEEILDEADKKAKANRSIAAAGGFGTGGSGGKKKSKR